MLLSVVGLGGLVVLNLRAQLRTQEKLDALAAAVADRAEPPAAAQPVVPAAIPRETIRVTLPPYLIEAPDQLLIEAVLKDPKTGTTDRLPNQPISGPFNVRPDGTVGLGLYGSVHVSGLTTEQAVAAVRKHLAEFKSPELAAEKLLVIVEVLAYNSKCYYVIYDSANKGLQIVRLPLTGNETVIDALANVCGLAQVAGKKSVRVVRKSPNGAEQTLQIDWDEITTGGMTKTNYQLMPSDRLYVTKAGD